MDNKPTISVSLGDPGGVGPEVILQALSDKSRRISARYLIHGSSHAMHLAAEALGIDPFWWRVDARSPIASTADAHDVVLLDSDPELIDEGLNIRFPKMPNKLSGRLSFEWVERAIADTKRDQRDPLRSDAIVTGPINKQAWAMAGKKRYPGHTELLAQRLNAKYHAMMFVGDKLRVVLATVHIPINEIKDKLTIGAVHTAIDQGHQACVQLGFARPRIAVCGLNPHAGEDGLMGDEESRIISPAIDHAVNSGILASGPYPGDTIFNAAIAGKFDLVVAMYHDQGLIPVKLLERDLAVNVTLGLPTVRTSPDHGTAFDIAGKGIADPGSMSHAIDLAIKMCTESPEVVE
ncbi:MAG: 4-hydroxythreonine-4-phosphate dehydrogenase PdxA [Phycisphaerales bacterium]|nr:4-hydroxythreonine-4-phosphate dehydrogenase PdxA [Phycisphaerales bacterium]